MHFTIRTICTNAFMTASEGIIVLIQMHYNNNNGIIHCGGNNNIIHLVRNSKCTKRDDLIIIMM